MERAFFAVGRLRVRKETPLEVMSDERERIASGWEVE